MSGGVVERKIKTLIFARVWWCIGCNYWCQLLADAVNREKGVGGGGGVRREKETSTRAQWAW